MSELHARRGADREVLDLEELTLLEGEQARHQVGGEDTDAVAQVANVGVVEPAGPGDAVLGVAQLPLNSR